MKARVLVARNLRRLRVRRSVSQENLAVDAGVDRTYVSGLENPTIAVLERLAIALQSELVDFFVKPKPGEPPPRSLPGGRRPGTRNRR